MREKEKQKGKHGRRCADREKDSHRMRQRNRAIEHRIEFCFE